MLIVTGSDKRVVGPHAAPVHAALVVALYDENKWQKTICRSAMVA